MPEFAPVPDLAKVLWPLTTLEPRPKPQPQPKKTAGPKQRGGIDVGAVITRALTAAGLMK